MPLTYYIDGYNIIHFCPQLRPLAQNSFEGARDTLIERVSMFCSTTHDKAKIVFDGRGRRPDASVPLRAAHGLEVVYSPGHQTADALIERQVYAAANRKELVVVTGDRGIRNICHGLGSLVMDPNNFLSSVEEALREARDLRQISQPPTLNSRVEDRLDDAGLSRLKAIRDGLSK